VHDVRFVQRVAVEVELFVHEMQAVAGNAHDAFDEGLLDVDRIAENDDVAAMRVAVGQQIFRDGSGGRVGELIDQQVVAHKQRVFHGAGGDDEGLYKRSGAEQKKNNGDGPFGDEPAGWFGRFRITGRFGFGRDGGRRF